MIVLVHGIAGSWRTWARVLPALAEHHTVVALDLPGHGESDKPRGDYSLGNHASIIRDLLVVLGHRRATFVGHSLGGGVVMQLSYQYPELCERMILVSSGGLGRDVSPLLRALSLPGAEYVLPVVLNGRVHSWAAAVGAVLGRVGLRGTPAMEEVWAGWSGLTEARAQRAFVHTLRSVVDSAGQRVSAANRLYLAADVPILVIWGGEDRIIPVAHAHDTASLLPHSRLEIIPGAGHFVPAERPAQVVRAIEDFLATTTPAPSRVTSIPEAVTPPP